MLAEPTSRHERRNEYTLLPLVIPEDPTRFAPSLRPFCHGPDSAPPSGRGYPRFDPSRRTARATGAERSLARADVTTAWAWLGYGGGLGGHSWCPGGQRARTT